MMNRFTQLRTWVDGHYAKSTGVAIVALGIWQMLIALFGVDLCDTGYYLTFYDNIFTAPGTVEYNFMYYLSGVVGGVLKLAMPACEWLLMRLAGVLCNVLAMMLVAVALRRLVPASAVILGLTMVVASLVRFPYTFNNDLLSALLWVASLAAVLRGLRGGGRSSWLLAGVLVGVNTFSRIPNILALGLVAMPFVAVAYRRSTWGEAWQRAGAMLAGALTGFAAVVAMMALLGHLSLFWQNMTELLGIATGQSGEATHNVSLMLGGLVTYYGKCALTALKLGLPLAVALVVSRHTQWTWLKWVVWLAATLVMLHFMWWQEHIMLPLWAMAIVGCGYVIVTGNYERRMAAWLGVYMLLVFPLGSDGATNNGGIIAWMAAPVAACLWSRRQWMVLPLIFIVVGMAQTWTRGAYFDGGHLWVKCATVNDPRAFGIRTTTERAQAINATLESLNGEVEPGDTLLCYGSIPMMNHLTRTRPAMGCAWPELLSVQALKERLDNLGAARPAVLRQKFDTLGAYWGTPSDDYLNAYPAADKFREQRKMDVLNDFLSQNGYRIVWQNQWFALYKLASSK